MYKSNYQRPKSTHEIATEYTKKLKNGTLKPSGASSKQSGTGQVSAPATDYLHGSVPQVQNVSVDRGMSKDEMELKIFRLEQELAAIKKDLELKEGTDAKFKKEYEDMMHNLDDDNMSVYALKEKEGMKASIQVNADSIISTVESAFGPNVTMFRNETAPYKPAVDADQGSIYFNSYNQKYYKWNGTEWAETTAPPSSMKSQITQTAAAIESEVEARTNEDDALYSRITQTAESISTVVARTFTVKEYSRPSPYTPPAGSSHDVLWKNTDNGLFYYWSDITNQWKSATSASVSSHFTQTEDGFLLDGDVVVTGDVVGSRFWNGEQGAYIIVGYRGANYADLNLYRSGDSTAAFTIEDNLSAHWLRRAGIVFLETTGSTTHPQRTWDFSGTTAVNGLATTSDGVHNHGIHDGTKLATCDTNGNITGWVEFSENYPHYHEVKKA